MKKLLISGMFWVLLANLLVKPLWLLGIEVGVQNAVGTTMYGIYFGIFNITYIFNILLDLGITNFNTRNIAQYPHLIRKHLSGILSIKLLLLMLYMVVTFSVGLLRGFDAFQFKLLAIISINQFLNSLILYLRSNFEGLLLFKWDSLLSVLDRLVMVVVCGMLLWGPEGMRLGQFSIMHFAGAQTVAYLLTAIIALVVLARKSGLRRLHFNLPFAMVIIRRSLPFALLVLLMASYNRLDPILLQVLSPDGLGNYNAGVYAGAFRLLDALTMVAYLVSVPLLPIFSKLTRPDGSQPHHVSPRSLAHENDRNNNPNELSDMLRMVFGMMTVYSLTAACVLSSLGNDLMSLFYADNIEDYADVFRILVFCIIPISMTYVFGTLLTAAGKLRTLNIFAASALLLNIVVNLVCIPLWGARGSAIAGLTAQSFMAVAQIVAVLLLFNIKLKTSYIIKVSLFALSVLACTLYMPHLVWWLSILVEGSISITMAILLKLIDIKDMIKLMKSE